MKPGKGKLLTLVLIFGFLSQIYALIFLFNWDAFQIIYLEIPLWLWAYQFGLTIVAITLLICVWFLKKWAVFLSFGVGFIFILVEMFLVRPLESLPLNLFSAITIYIAIISIWFYVIFRKWKEFH